MRQIVSDTGPLISLEKLSQGYDFIRQLYDKLIIAPAVLEEVAAGQFATPKEYLQHYGISDLIEVRTVSQPHELPEAERLHEGETQAIQLALELQLCDAVIGHATALCPFPEVTRGLVANHARKRDAVRVRNPSPGYKVLRAR